MTAQIHDHVEYAGVPYSLSAVHGEPLFDPAAHGLRPVMMHTACYRGFYVMYAVTNGELVLRELAIKIDPADRAANGGAYPVFQASPAGRTDMATTPTMDCRFRFLSPAPCSSETAFCASTMCTWASIQLGSLSASTSSRSARASWRRPAIDRMSLLQFERKCGEMAQPRRKTMQNSLPGSLRP